MLAVRVPPELRETIEKAAVAAGTTVSASALRAGDNGGAWTRGSLTLRYVFRAGTNTVLNRYDTDQDLTEDLFAEGGYGEHVRFELSGRVRQDIDGRPPVSRFRDIYDTYGSWATGWLYTAYAEGLDLGPLARARFGRQYYAEGVEVRFDGGLVETAPLGDVVRLIAYGGVPVQLYESSVRGDWLAGAGVEVVAIPRTELRLEYTHLTTYDDQARKHRWEGVPANENRDDDRFQATLVYRPIDKLRFFARGSTFDGRSTRGEGEVLYQDIEVGFSARVRYVAQVGAYRDLSIPFTPLDEQLGRYRPYHEILVHLRQQLGDHFALSGGGALRKLFTKSDEGTFNHEFARAFGQVDVVSFPIEGLTITLIAEYYRSLTLGRSFQGSGEISQEFAKIFTVGAGSRYSAFKLDDYFLKERENVRSYYGFAQLRPTEFLRFRLGYSYETDDEDRFHVVRLDARLDF